MSKLSALKSFSLISLAAVSLSGCGVLSWFGWDDAPSLEMPALADLDYGDKASAVRAVETLAGHEEAPSRLNGSASYDGIASLRFVQSEAGSNDKVHGLYGDMSADVEFDRGNGYTLTATADNFVAAVTEVGDDGRAVSQFDIGGFTDADAVSLSSTGAGGSGLTRFLAGETELDGVTISQVDGAITVAETAATDDAVTHEFSGELTYDGLTVTTSGLAASTVTGSDGEVLSIESILDDTNVELSAGAADIYLLELLGLKQ